MNLSTADKITKDWGKFLETVNGNLMIIFLAKIPQCLLPYPKEKIKEALDIYSKYYGSLGNKEGAMAADSAASFLDFYTDDKEALGAAAKNFSSKKYLEAIIPSLSQPK